MSDADVAQGKMEQILIDLLNDGKRQEKIRKAALAMAIKDTGSRIITSIKEALGNNP